MSVISMKQLLEAGVHFGHQTKKWNPKMKKYIFTSRKDKDKEKDIHIINLEQTSDLIDRAYAFMNEMAKTGKPVLFVCTKKQIADAIKEEAVRCGAFNINTRWLGGTLTNFKTIRQRIERLNKLNQMEKVGEFELLTKKEVSKLKAEQDKLNIAFGGIKEMSALPCVIFIVDPNKEHICVKEANSLNIPLIGLVDTNCNPDGIDYIIPGNDDAVRSVKLIAGALADAVIEAREGVAPSKSAETEENVNVAEILAKAPVSAGDKKEAADNETKEVKTIKKTAQVNSETEKTEKNKKEGE